MDSKGQDVFEQVGTDALQRVGNRVIRKIARIPNANNRGYFVRDNYKENKNYVLSCLFKTQLYKNPNEFNEENEQYIKRCEIIIEFQKGKGEFKISSLVLLNKDEDDTALAFIPDEDVYDVDATIQGNSPNLQISKVLINLLTNRRLDFTPQIYLWEDEVFVRNLASQEPGATAPRISCTSQGYVFTLLS